MFLSCLLRMLCLVLVSIGLIDAALSLLLRSQASALDRALITLNARRQERAYFALPVISPLTANLLALTFIVPLYRHAELNPPGERVGLFSIAGASIVAIRYSCALLRALRYLYLSRPLHSQGTAHSIAGVPVRLSPCKHPLIAVTGILSPEIIVSRQLLAPAALSPEALAHEKAHVAQLDNLKLLILSSLVLRADDSAVVNRWRRTAEIAAAEEAVTGSRARAPAGRHAPHTCSPVFQWSAPALVLPLLAHEEELEICIHRLIGNDARMTPCRGLAQVNGDSSLSGHCSLRATGAVTRVISLAWRKSAPYWVGWGDANLHTASSYSSGTP